MTPASVDGDWFAAVVVGSLAVVVCCRLVTSSDFTGSASHVFYWSCVGIVVLGRRRCWCHFADFQNSANGSGFIIKHGVGPPECSIDYYSSTFSLTKNI